MDKKTIIKKSKNDKNFRRIVKEAIDSAKCEIIVIAGELGSYLFPELNESAKQALKRGVHVKVYATYTVPSNVYSEIRNLGGEIYIGDKQVKDHYLVIDGKTYIISKKEQIGKPIRTGGRWAILYENAPLGARKIKKLFNELAFFSFIEEDKDRSILTKMADTIFQCLIPSYGEVMENMKNA